ncbi:phage tail terminator-like protein [Candidatus Contendibacter odensensis]|uniref:Phage tail protein n=1 Tax=Candidatus Contendobacter odensis Run_B_J11 TaxID=1400861 RepID=A0A7U7G943_9GAMM|nr:phage tail terminator-like protein [Candidatus Contendobacter odensis]CDH43849.1 hypothetical protein BN874_1370014 [Candidatus Contendobacter odensis Run_B_J11]
MTPELRAAFRTQLLTLAGLPAVAWQNRAFTPPNNAPWCKEALLPGEGRYAAFGADGISNGAMQQVGIYQITLVMPSGADTVAADTLADRIISLFRPGTRLTMSTGDVITCENAWASPSQQEPTGFSLPVSVRYRFFRLNT